MIKASLHKKLLAASADLDLKLELTVAKGSFNALFGPSGAGKTSSLRMLSGFMKPDSGLISAGTETWFDSGKGINIKPRQRNIGFVFQNLALFPNMSVLENMRYAAGKHQDETLFNELLEVTELAGLADQRPQKLSGGQQRRAALIRAIAQQPDLLLLDEPFSALDDETRLRLQDYLAELHHRFKFAVILVSHDIAEVCKLAENVWQLKQGEIVKSGTPAEVFGYAAKTDQLLITAKIIAVSDAVLTLAVNGKVVNWKPEDNNGIYRVGEIVSITIDSTQGKLTKIKSTI